MNVPRPVSTTIVETLERLKPCNGWYRFRDLLCESGLKRQQALRSLRWVASEYPDSIELCAQSHNFRVLDLAPWRNFERRATDFRPFPTERAA